MPATKKRVSASEVLRHAHALSRSGRSNWFSRLKPDDRDWLLNLRREYAARKHEQPEASVLLTSVKQHVAINIHINTFRTWLKGN